MIWRSVARSGSPFMSTRGERRVEVGVAETEVREIELGRRRGRLAQRVDVREEVTAHAVRVDEVEDASLDPRGLEHRLGRERHRGRRAHGDVERAVLERDRGVPIRGRSPVARLDARAVAVRGDAPARLVRLEEGAPLGVDGLRSLLPERVELFDVARVDAEFVEHRTFCSLLVGM